MLTLPMQMNTMVLHSLLRGNHFFWNKTFGHFVTDAGVIHLSDSISDHLLIYNRAKPTSNTRPNAIPRWKKSSDTQKQDYFNDFKTDLQNITITSFVIDCQDVHCKNEQHKLTSNAGGSSIGRKVSLLTDSNSKPNVNILNWKTEIEQFRENAQF